ncbi:hypothetical protein PHLCEN_2v9361 [Hermanssonia centrifuga]|uniref:RING-type domain-containing protein n=1 Tax=Hermanssonia centrifuga TaxID=98765 RepID=A0A2R6NR11_9APHY|nr:hypothetical protein PHLCEN_2v9361 [Hermanssonia centrifuga]
MDDLDGGLVPLTVEQRIKRAVEKLPTLSPDHVPLQDSCPICLMTFSSIVDGSAQSEGSLAESSHVQLSGVTKLEGCGHVFCRVEYVILKAGFTSLIEWIRGRHGTCPACRHTFLDVKPPSDSDNESSDGDYIPGDDEDEDEDDGFLDTDGFTDTDEFDFEVGMDIDGDGFHDYEVELDEDIEVDADLDAWGVAEDGNMDNLGLSDGYGSESLSETDLVVSGEDDSFTIDEARVCIGEDEGAIQSTSENTAK